MFPVDTSDTCGSGHCTGSHIFTNSTASERYFDGILNIFSAFARFCPATCVSDADITLHLCDISREQLAVE
jgi:hypothetical protein